MKKTVYLFTFFFCSNLFTYAQLTFPDSGLVAYYMLDGNGADSSINSNHGTLYNVYATMNRNGDLGKAMHFSGMLGYIRVPDHPSLDLGQKSAGVTVSVWYKSENIGLGLQYIIGKNPGSSTYSDYTLGFYPSPSAVFWSTGESIDTCSQSEYWNVPSENVWHQIICTYDSTSTPKGRKTIFIDGEKVYECTSNIRATANNFDLLIGSRLNNGYSPDAFFQGTIDELRIYNRAFGDCEAAQSFKSYTITPTLANKNNVYYTKGGIYSLTGNPTGGVFSGTGINNNKFDASALSQGTHKISYTYRDKNSCNWESDFYLNIDTGYVTSVEADDDSYLDFDVLPNPLSLDFTIKSVADITGFSILEITNAIGNVVSKSEIEFINGMYNGTINRSIIPNGIYFFRIINGHHSGVDKVVIVE